MDVWTNEGTESDEVSASQREVAGQFILSMGEEYRDGKRVVYPAFNENSEHGQVSATKGQLAYFGVWRPPRGEFRYQDPWWWNPAPPSGLTNTTLALCNLGNREDPNAPVPRITVELGVTGTSPQVWRTVELSFGCKVVYFNQTRDVEVIIVRQQALTGWTTRLTRRRLINNQMFVGPTWQVANETNGVVGLNAGTSVVFYNARTGT